MSVAENEVAAPNASSPVHGLPAWGPSGFKPAAGSPSSSGSSSGPSGTVTISWQPPRENTNGTALTDLAGYTIHYGTSSQNYTSPQVSVRVD